MCFDLPSGHPTAISGHPTAWQQHTQNHHVLARVVYHALPYKFFGPAFCLPAIILSGSNILWSLIGILLVAFSFGILAKKQVGGQTGDVCGAGQVLSETTGLIVLVAIIANPTD